MTIEHRL